MRNRKQKALGDKKPETEVFGEMRNRKQKFLGDKKPETEILRETEELNETDVF